MKDDLTATQETRIAELQAIFEGIDDGMRKMVLPLIAETAYLEAELDFLRELPKIRVHPDDPRKQQATPAAKMYKEFVQQYTNCIKTLASVLRREETEEESPLRAYLESRRKLHAGEG